jgi:hypothetical protein
MSIKTIRRILKKAFDRINNEKAKQNILQALPFWNTAHTFFRNNFLHLHPV